MSKVLKGSFELMKQLNVSAVLKVIKDNGSLSRAEIAKLTYLWYNENIKMLKQEEKYYDKKKKTN